MNSKVQKGEFFKNPLVDENRCDENIVVEKNCVKDDV